MLLMGKSTISMAIFNSYVKLPEGIYIYMCVYIYIYVYVYVYTDYKPLKYFSLHIQGQQGNPSFVDPFP